ncbi:acyl-CoA dehydrogenase C-terminal domain-containing protein [Xanthomonas graminis]|jgi:alkylation response protein AidB-like acyl-CoA dehydrogenase|uniref:3-methylmercaptopropionyl-CoA dehydrogenase n=1 Tax=Xanthomonas graminis pv. graminis TaxID=134874 RepID=A0A1M4JIV8_9XANT|nr:acyl-CoA dehydrogenase C-terminal domain-containing protein [Xanthomonas translucens]EKU25039.1 acyl-CoA dehydrogenase [Xanthomonas translucens pv. graminis ART-Xtg29]OAX59790.1 acyl-CoA dehydrogenase [Xanthomonas translucens pv. graminis]UKE52941.1 acyl-CoA dehydrogenase C-terminal domain-containing protein [Xanthomonas translucens pv. graminis]WIH10171.1 acyl-CoA dehydrogenase C-terminal domain-containing protein [Xanthomonas translucens pv. graminis]WIH13571.1 acyl-CoA dehydrogenase C-te
MSTYQAPLTDLRFALHDVLQVEALFARLGYAEATADVVDAVLEEAARFTGTVLAPLNRVGDEHGCTLDAATGAVTTAPGFREAYRQFADGGWTGLTAAVEFGGQGLPHTLGVPLNEMVNAANLAWGNFPLLSHGAVEALKQHGEAWQQEVFLKPLVDGRWTGTMCLTEPHCGTDLGLLKTRADANADGSWSVSGTKIFITAGEHDFTDNIVHLVLARLPDAPAGAKGISLLVVPKFKVARDGSVGARNAVRCGSLEHKMGIHGSATCVMHFDGAEGYLVGQPHKGLQAMFTMMNTARLSVGLQGIGLSERAYQNALRYARERLQSRSLTGAKLPDKPADPILVHPDVRRMLLTVKALTEGSRLLALHAATLIDIAHHAQDPAEREQADVLVSFLTPISKACQTEWGVENTYHALQCFGGHGYIHEHGMEQLARDARITTLYEGTTGIQALDLIGRKTASSQGAGLKLFLAQIEAFAAEHADNPALAEFIGPLRAKAGEWAALTKRILQRAAGNADELGASSYDYVFYSGYVVLAYWWARSVAAADASAHGETFKQSKRETARFYYAKLLPRTLTHAAVIEAGAEPLMAMSDAHF